MRGLSLHLAACLLAGMAAWTPPPARTAAPPTFPGWPTAFEGRPLRELELTPGEAGLALQFPGRMGKLTDGTRQLLVRYVERDTRLLHAPAECMKNLGYDVRPLPPRRDAQGRTWGVFAARKEDRHFVVRERIEEVGGARGYSDVSSWYWAAALGRSQGPWWAVAVAEPAPEHGSAAAPAAR